CGFGSGTNTNSGMNSNRTSQTIDGVSSYYCYDYADALTGSSDPNANGASYDTHGNMTVLGTNASPLRLYYDSSNRNRAIEQYTSDGNGMGMYYDRDVSGRVTGRYENSIANWNWTDSGNDNNYDYSGPDDAPDYVRNDNTWDIIEKYLVLPGNVLLTIRP